MDRDGTRDGFDLGLTRAVVDAVDVPVVASGGVGRLQDLVDGASDGGADAVLAASIFHRREFTIGEAKAYMAARGVTGPPGLTWRGSASVRYRDLQCRRSTRKNGAADAATEDKQPISVLFDRVMVQISPSDGERRSRAGILIPATAQISRRLTWAEAMAVGPHVRTVKVGDTVLFNPEDRFEVEVHGEEYVILRERDIHAIASTRNDSGTGLYL